MDRAMMFHDMTDAELQSKLADLRQELFNLRFQHATGQLKNPLILNTLKKDIARAMTIIKERESQLPRNPGRAANADKGTGSDSAPKKASGGKK